MKQIKILASVIFVMIMFFAFNDASAHNRGRRRNCNGNNTVVVRPNGAVIVKQNRGRRAAMPMRQRSCNRRAVRF